MFSAQALVFDYPHHLFEHSAIVHADCFDWLARLPENSLHAIVTDPPYGVKEYEAAQLEKRRAGRGGVWRIPPAFDGHTRALLPRFTALSHKERGVLEDYFVAWAKLAVHALRPGGHLFFASNTLSFAVGVQRPSQGRFRISG